MAAWQPRGRGREQRWSGEAAGVAHAAECGGGKGCMGGAARGAGAARAGVLLCLVPGAVRSQLVR
jgi:hypothetical protein